MNAPGWDASVVVLVVGTLVVAAALWPVVILVWRRIDAALAMDTLRADPTDVADLENQLPHIPGDPHFVITASDIEYLEAVARYRESGRSDGEEVA